MASRVGSASAAKKRTSGSTRVAAVRDMDASYRCQSILTSINMKPRMRAGTPLRDDKMTLNQESIHDEVRARYADAAQAAGSGRSDSDAQASCCAPNGSIVFGDALYAAADRADLPEAAVLASLGCGNPTAVAD